MSTLGWANTALRHAKFTLVIGAGNITSNAEKTGGMSQEYTMRSRFKPVEKYERGRWEEETVFRVTVPVFKRDPNAGWALPLPLPSMKYPVGDDWRENIRDLARRGREWRSGNCQEHAAVAFEYLDEHARFVGMISYVVVPDHAFVVLGRDTGNSGRFAAEWGGDAVICDPWGGYVCTQPQLLAGTGQVFSTFGDPRGPRDMSIAGIQQWIVNHEAKVLCEVSRYYMTFPHYD